MNTKKLIEEALLKSETLQVEERALVVDSILLSLSPPRELCCPIRPLTEIDKKWALLAKKRLSEIRAGSVSAASGEEVFKKIWDRFSK